MAVKKAVCEKGLSKRSVSTIRLKLMMDCILKYSCNSHLDVGANVTPYVDFTNIMGLRTVRCDIKRYTDNMVIGGLPELPFKNSTFDIVSCFDVLEHLPEPERNLKELCRIAKRVVIIGMPEVKSSVYRGDASHITPFTYTKLRRMQVENWLQIIYGDNNLHKFFKGISYVPPALFSEAFIVVYINRRFA